MKLDRFEWLASRREDALEPETPIVDSHHHLWNRGGSRYLAEELAQDARSGHGVEETVFVECLASYRQDGPPELRPVGETEMVVAEAERLEAAQEVRIAGIVGFADLAMGEDVAGVLEAHEVAGKGLFKGVRHATAIDETGRKRQGHHKAPPGLMCTEPFLEGVRTLGERGHTFDAWLYHRQLPELVSLARSVPATSIVVGHLGGPLLQGSSDPEGELRRWQEGVEALAEAPNVTIKLGGIGMDDLFEVGWAQRQTPPRSQEVAEHWGPLVQHCIRAFGADRCMFESNFPVDRQSFPYVVVWNVFKQMTASLSAADRAQLFAGTARRVYRL